MTCWSIVCETYLVVSSKYIQDELTEKLVEKFSYSMHDALVIHDVVFERMELYTPVIKNLSGIPDADDVPVIGTAIAAKADVIITGDKQLLALKKFSNIPLIPPAEFQNFESDNTKVHE